MATFSFWQQTIFNRQITQKTHKINVVRMDIQRRHAALGVLKTRGKRKLGHDDNPAESTTEDLPSDNEGEDFGAVAHNLIVAAIDDRAADEAVRICFRLHWSQTAPSAVADPFVLNCRSQHCLILTDWTVAWISIGLGLSRTWMPRLMLVRMHSLSRLQTCKMLR